MRPSGISFAACLPPCDCKKLQGETTLKQPPVCSFIPQILTEQQHVLGIIQGSVEEAVMNKAWSFP